MRHELRLLSHNYEGPGIQPYCVCGWIGTAVHFFEQSEAMDAYATHLKASYGDTERISATG